MRTEYVTFPTTDGLIHQGLLYQPDQPSSKILVHVHGMAGNFYENQFVHVMGQQLAAAGWALFSFNNRGHDYIAQLPKKDAPDGYLLAGDAFERFEDCVSDIAGAIDCVSERGFSTVALQGHSLGASKVTYYLTQTNDARVNRLLLAAPADMVGLLQDEDDAKEKYATAERLVEAGTGDQFLSKKIWDWYWLSATTYLNFATPGNAIDVINTHQPDAPSALNSVAIPALVYFGDQDDAVIKQLSVIKALTIIKAKLMHAPAVETAILPNADHSYCGKEREVSQMVMNWLTSEK